jgi:AMP nucleosidase
MKMEINLASADLPVSTPEYDGPQSYSDANQTVKALSEIYHKGTEFLQSRFAAIIHGEGLDRHYRAFYPEIRFVTSSYANVDSRLAYGHVTGPGEFYTTVTRPDLFSNYLHTQISLLLANHGVPIIVGVSDKPIPLHFALPEGTHVDSSIHDRLERPLRDIFDAPNLVDTDDRIANGEFDDAPGLPQPLAPFTAPRIDYSLQRLSHYTATSPSYFQNYVLFTNYQFYIDEFVQYARTVLEKNEDGYESLVEPGNVITRAGKSEASGGIAPRRGPQMPAYHLTRNDRNGITLVNIGVGPSNAKTITDHIAVLRPHTWLMLGHCAGLRNSQSLGDYVLAHAYVREDNVLNDDLPVWVPIPALAEVQIALQEAVAEVTGLSGYELKKIMRTGTVATIDNRNWELRDQSGPVQRLSQSRAVALDMESATIAANGFRFRVPYGTLLCVSDKPLHGELKLPGMATEFYSRQVAQHLIIGIRALEALREMPSERLHSRKLRSFSETAFQ